MVKRIAADSYGGRALDPSEVLPICGFIVGATAIAVVLSPLIVLCALYVIAIESTRLLFGSVKFRGHSNPPLVRSEQK